MLIFIILAVIGLVAVLTLASSIKFVGTNYEVIVEKMGVYNRTLEPGVHFLIPFVERAVKKMSLKRQIIDAEPQECITSDNVSVLVDTIIQFNILSAKEAYYNIENYKAGINASIRTSIRAIVGTMTLDELFGSRESINKKILSILDNETDAYGVKIISCEIKNIKPPKTIVLSMEQLVTSTKTKQAKITEAEGDKRSAIESAEGVKQASILKAESEKESRILKAQADKEYAVLQAEGQKEAIKLNAEAKANAIRIEAEAEAEAIKIKAKAEAEALEQINDAIISSGTDERVIAFKQIEGFIEMTKNPANKLILPVENMNTLGNISAIAETLKISNNGQEKPAKNK